MLDTARSGTSGVLVVRGPVGIGKSALLDFVQESGNGFRVIAATGIESEMELAFAGLHQLCAPLLGGLSRLPVPQRRALETAFGLAEGPRPDGLLIGLATLSLLSEAGEAQPLLCVIDDAQWLDRASAQAMALAARRLQVDRVAVVFGVRTPTQRDELTSLPTIDLVGLSDVDALALLSSAVAGRLDERVAARIVAESEGNPLALLELPRTRRPADLAGGFALTSTPLRSRLEASFFDRAEQLPPETRWLLLLAAGEPVGDSAVLWRAASTLDVPRDAAAPAEDAGLVQIGATVRFRHPLVRSAIYEAASLSERRAAHAALAEASDPDLDPDRRAWHRGEATRGLDDAVADELERSAQRARARGGIAAEAAFLERSAALTADPDRRVERALAAAEAKFDAGAPGTALELVAVAESGPINELQRARAERIRAQVAVFQDRGSEAALLLVNATSRLESLSPALARETYLDALWAAMTTGSGRAVIEAIPAAAASREPSPTELLLTGLVRLMTDGFPAGTDLLKQAMRAFVSEPVTAHDLRALPIVFRIAQSEWDDESMDVLASRWVRLARGEGALTTLPDALDGLSECQFNAGQLGAAAATLAEAALIAHGAGRADEDPQASGLTVAILQSDEHVAAELTGRALDDAAETGDDHQIGNVEVAALLMYNGLGRYQDALAVGLSQCERHAQGGDGRTLAELVEAAARSGDMDLARDTLQRLCDRTRGAATDWALGMVARSRALVSEGEDADAHYGEAVERLDRTRRKLELGRTRLIYGEWLRREGRRVDAREQLRIAYEMFDAMGALFLASRARRELLATGGALPRSRERVLVELTAQETVVARLASEGRTNQEIAAQLFLSPHTVDYHLRKVFRKLDVNARGQLTRDLLDRVSSPAASVI